MWHKGELFDISRDVWQSFSSKQLLKSEGVLEIEDLLSMQWFYCHLSSNFVVMLAIDLRVGYQLASSDKTRHLFAGHCSAGTPSRRNSVAATNCGYASGKTVAASGFSSILSHWITC